MPVNYTAEEDEIRLIYSTEEQFSFRKKKALSKRIPHKQ